MPNIQFFTGVISNLAIYFVRYNSLCISIMGQSHIYKKFPEMEFVVQCFLSNHIINNFEAEIYLIKSNAWRYI